MKADVAEECVSWCWWPMHVCPQGLISSLPIRIAQYCSTSAGCAVESSCKHIILIVNEVFLVSESILNISSSKNKFYTRLRALENGME
jgi:hypothetical protein